MCYPAAKPGVEQCCSGEGFEALSSNSSKSSSQSPLLSLNASYFVTKNVIKNVVFNK